MSGQLHAQPTLTPRLVVATPILTTV